MIISILPRDVKTSCLRRQVIRVDKMADIPEDAPERKSSHFSFVLILLQIVCMYPRLNRVT